MKKDPEYKDYPFDAAEKVHSDGICTNTDKWVYTSDFCSEAKKLAVKTCSLMNKL